ncbi:MAG: Peptide deformylase [Chlamydiae bacterium]|nr:Peptide deformylase [Chlamydiota bacterium]
MKLPIAYYGNPILRKKCKDVEEFDDEIREFVNNMIETLEDKNGIGLAAPQVNRELRIFITKVPYPSKDDPDQWEDGTIKVYINPKLSEPSAEAWERDEGCLSIPKIYIPVIRPYRVKVEAMDLKGNVFTEELSGLEARCVMHENDHINGVLMIDRIQGEKRKEIESELRSIKKELGSQ